MTRKFGEAPLKILLLLRPSGRYWCSRSGLDQIVAFLQSKLTCSYSMNYQSPGGCLNYKSVDGCLTYRSKAGCKFFQHSHSAGTRAGILPAHERLKGLQLTVHALFAATPDISPSSDCQKPRALIVFCNMYSKTFGKICPVPVLSYSTYHSSAHQGPMLLYKANDDLKPQV